MTSITTSISSVFLLKTPPLLFLFPSLIDHLDSLGSFLGPSELKRPISVSPPAISGPVGTPTVEASTPSVWINLHRLFPPYWSRHQCSWESLFRKVFRFGYLNSLVYLTNLFSVYPHFKFVRSQTFHEDTDQLVLNQIIGIISPSRPIGSTSKL